MPRFQSRLFNWIDRSWPVQAGRGIRRSLDQKLKQMTGLPLQELPRLLAYQVAKAALYPVYLVASAAKKTFPLLDSSQVEARENLRSQPYATGLLSETLPIKEDLDNAIRQTDELTENLPVDLQTNAHGETLKSEIPLLWRPLVKFFNWIDRTKIRIDRNIATLVKREPDGLADRPELESKLLANRIFAEIWRQVEQGQTDPNNLKTSSGLTENVALGRNTRLEQLRRLIEAAIAYFFGNQSQSSQIQDENVTGNAERPEIHSSEISDEQILSGTAPFKQRSVTPSQGRDRLFTARKASAKNSLQTNSSPAAIPNDAGDLTANATLAESNNLDRLRDLIVAAIDYFIGKRSLDGDGSTTFSDANNDAKGTPSELLSAEFIDKLQTSMGSSVKGNQPSNDSSSALKPDNQLERLQKLIEQAIAYFFGKQKPTLKETSDITPTEEAWLTMEEVFGDDNGPWPLPLEYESIAFNKSPDRQAIHSSGELQNSETTTTQISQDRLVGNLVFEEELLDLQQSNSDPESDRPLKAWIEANASLLGYVYNPVMTVIFWVDAIVLKIENLIIGFWRGLISFPKRLIRFIRYGRR
ncbi:MULTISPECIES: hypothetical protein [Pseudanabaena]|uniref:Uncharacterized protein n=2 Tax=Pseudanabaena TaxID=1152 RepID=L8N512_9CYAN|nr:MULTISPECIES: hypothetical protein [Pseudanabaena]ELS33308.1 hypothetical protein Pse7429DRAFT_1544 [Pseudanabaena biceps PCC 7429]MDG3494489.1 hypothetical protein [Pseudanabaena catenata USMAC16]